MASIAFDNLKYAAKLKAGGFSDEQANTETEALAEVLELFASRQMSELASKQDIKALEYKIEQVRAESQASDASIRQEIKELDYKIEQLRGELKRDIKEAELRMEARLAETKSELIRWVVSVGLLQSALVVGVLMKVAHLL
jgi:hypothetical protein